MTDPNDNLRARLTNGKVTRALCLEAADRIRELEAEQDCSSGKHNWRYHNKMAMPYLDPYLDPFIDQFRECTRCGKREESQ